MAVSVTKLLTLGDSADTATGWSGNSGGQDLYYYVQGGATPASYTWQVAKNSTKTCIFTKSMDMSGYTYPHLYFPMRCDVAQFLLARASGGLTIRLTDDAANYTEWYVAGYDTWDGSISYFILDLLNTGDISASSGTLSLSTIASITWSASAQNINFRAIDNLWNDAFYYGEGLKATGTDFGIAEISADDGLLINAYGISQKKDDNNIIKGKLQIGDGATTTTFTSDGELITFKDPTTSGKGGGAIGSVNSNLYEIRATGSGCTYVHKNGVIKAAGSVKYLLSLDNTDLAGVTLTGMTIKNANAVNLLADNIKASIVINTFDSCGIIKPQGSEFNKNIISNTIVTGTDGALYLGDATTIANTADITFNNYTGKYAIHIPATVTGSISLDNFVGDLSGTDIYWAGTGGTLTVNAINGTNFTTWSSAGGTVDIQTSVSLTLTDLPNGIEVRIKQGSHTLQHTQNVTGNQVVYSYNYTGDEYVKISFVGAGIIQSKTLKLTLSNIDITQSVTFEQDPSYI